jgi:hypothetical protein
MSSDGFNFLKDVFLGQRGVAKFFLHFPHFIEKNFVVEVPGQAFFFFPGKPVY